VGCPRIVSTDVDGFICKAIDGAPASADHLSRLEEEGWRDGQVEDLGGLEVDDELECRGLLHRQAAESCAEGPVYEARLLLRRGDAGVAVGAREAIEGCHHLHLAAGSICDRVAIKRAAPVGLTVMEYKPFDAKAADELQQLYTLAFAQRR
jgi:hypothetical protein